MCDFFGVDISGSATRKAPFINAIYGLLTPASVKFQGKDVAVVKSV